MFICCCFNGHTAKTSLILFNACPQRFCIAFYTTLLSLFWKSLAIKLMFLRWNLTKRRNPRLSLTTNLVNPFFTGMSCLFNQSHNITRRYSPTQTIIRISKPAFWKKALIHLFVLSIPQWSNPRAGPSRYGAQCKT